MADSASDRLLQAAADGSLEGVKEALQPGADIDARRQFGDTALNLAAEHGHKDVVQHLLDKGADIHNLGGADKTPIMNAAFAGNIGIVRLLLEKGARVTDDLLASVQLKVNDAWRQAIGNGWSIFSTLTFRTGEQVSFVAEC